jgi:hypothetical protein
LGKVAGHRYNCIMMYKSATTIDDIFRLAFPANTSLLAGEEYLGRSVTWACSLRPSPPAFPKLDGNELALIDMEDLRRLDPQMRLDRVVYSLQSARVAAIAVLGRVEASAINARAGHTPGTLPTAHQHHPDAGGAHGNPADRRPSKLRHPAFSGVAARVKPRLRCTAAGWPKWLCMYSNLHNSRSC